MRYGSKTIALPGMTGSQTINIGTGYEKLLAFYEKVRESAHSGEFDEILIKMSQEISKRLGH
ncbi:hypothetical protein AD945_04295 [Gluconobacter albidus]|uniref:Uncharacterized protein n=1 Tax=Gluconobacter albidus TaxID=318683 RepID=A0A149TL68_9PROT|nr:hypothetical protein AD945_04295 [Gluconobacter albidus]